jgi:hypothetical protein
LDIRIMQDRLALFEALRSSPRYRAVVGNATPTDVARALGLVLEGEPADWAVRMVADDQAGQFSRWEELAAAQRASKVNVQVGGAVAIGMSGLQMWIGAYGPDDWPADPFGAAPPTAWRGTSFAFRTGITKADWQQLEDDAVMLARQLVARLRADYAVKTIRTKGASTDDLRLQIQRLAYRLASQAGIRNDPRNDRRLCKRLGIDVPRKGGSSRAKKSP